MTRQAFNIAVAEKVMGWETLIVPTAECSSGYLYDSGAMRGHIDGPDFHGDHNGAAKVRARVAELGDRTHKLWLHHLLTLVDARGIRDFTWLDAWKIASATPEQTARAAYRAMTGEELEAVDAE